MDQKEIDELFDPLIQQADEMAQQATKRLGEIKNELKALDAERVSLPLIRSSCPQHMPLPIYHSTGKLQLLLPPLV